MRVTWTCHYRIQWSAVEVRENCSDAYYRRCIASPIQFGFVDRDVNPRAVFVAHLELAPYVVKRSVNNRCERIAVSALGCVDRRIQLFTIKRFAGPGDLRRKCRMARSLT